MSLNVSTSVYKRIVSVAEGSRIDARREWPAGTGMIYLAMSPWHGMWKNRQQLMSRFSREIPVVYVEPWVRMRRLRKQISEDGLSALSAVQPTLEQVGNDLYVFHSPPMLAVSGAKSLKSITRVRWVRAIKAAAAKLGITRPVLWLSLPEMHFAVGKFEEALSVYHIVDEYAGYTDVEGSRLRKREQHLLDSVDVSIVVSDQLHDSKAAEGRAIYTVENAVDYDGISASRGGPAPGDIANIPRPRLGYCGLIGKRLDLELIGKLAKRRPEWSFVFVGKVDPRDCEEELTRLEATPNVYFLGEKPSDQIGCYLHELDIGLLPYQRNLETENISPLKMYEYAAAGKHIVATAIPAAKKHGSIISLANDDRGFEQCCQDILDGGDCVIPSTKLFEFASSNTWEHRVSEIREILLWHLNQEKTASEPAESMRNSTTT